MGTDKFGSSVCLHLGLRSFSAALVFSLPTLHHNQIFLPYLRSSQRKYGGHSEIPLWGWHARKADKEFYPLHPVSNLLLLPERDSLSPERDLIYKAGLYIEKRYMVRYASLLGR